VILSENRFPLFGITRGARLTAHQNNDFAAAVAAPNSGAG
jgi:hypothetical protein